MLREVNHVGVYFGCTISTVGYEYIFALMIPVIVNYITFQSN
jgi:hypothetical protein